MVTATRLGASPTFLGIQLSRQPSSTAPRCGGTEFLHPTRVAAGTKGFQSGPIETIEILVAFTPPEFDDTTFQLLGGPGGTHHDASNR